MKGATEATWRRERAQIDTLIFHQRMSIIEHNCFFSHASVP
ncbi:rCG55805 [Rattus norvegicus]|uniref:RCG55805 n=1 Tax=Rattus norvegicus TaxID=10116 RepID=A6JM81_RAT|nr:rCG55805 [Rattus norvegicus]